MRPLDGVRELRERRMLTQQELADRAGVSLFTVQRIERGEGNVRPSTGRGIARVLGVGVEDLLPKVPAPPSNQPPLFNGGQERRTPTPSELNAIEAIKGFCDRLEIFLDAREHKGSHPGMWVIQAQHAIDVAAVSLPLADREHLRPVFIPAAARLTELAQRVFDGARDAGAHEEAKQRQATIRELTEAIA